MRAPSDLVRVRVTTTRELTVDLEQLEANPLFRSILDTIQTNSTNPNSTEPLLAVKEYLLHYISTDSFPHRTPGTTGPGNIYNVNVEVQGGPDQHGDKDTNSSVD